MTSFKEPTYKVGDIVKVELRGDLSKPCECFRAEVTVAATSDSLASPFPYIYKVLLQYNITKGHPIKGFGAAMPLMCTESMLSPFDHADMAAILAE